jgi:hypothetical protein
MGEAAKVVEGLLWVIVFGVVFSQKKKSLVLLTIGFFASVYRGWVCVGIVVASWVGLHRKNKFMFSILKTYFLIVKK